MERRRQDRRAKLRGGRRASDLRYRKVGGLEQYLCNNPDCEIGWQPLSQFYTSSGKKRPRCKTCLSEYQRNYWRERNNVTVEDTATERKKSLMLGAVRDLELHWPEPWGDVRFEDKGSYDYELLRWKRTPYDYDRTR